VQATINTHHISWPETDLDVFDGECEVGRIYRLDDPPDSGWFWGVSFQSTRRKRYGARAVAR
jgi:hypothetical protein